jgi:hypothetical protein
MSAKVTVEGAANEVAEAEPDEALVEDELADLDELEHAANAIAAVTTKARPPAHDLKRLPVNLIATPL